MDTYSISYTKMNEVIESIVEDKIIEIKKYGHAIPGHNGPYNDQDTPMRNSAHWLCSFCFLYKKYKDARHLESARILIDYLLSPNNYNENGVVKYRENKLSDYTNGIMGPAWIIESLAIAAKTFNDERCFEKAKELFLKEPFDRQLKLWKIVDTDNKEVSIDYVYNHQVWFAASGKLLCDYRMVPEIDGMIKEFLKNYKNNLIFQPSGLMFHQVNYDYSVIGRGKKYIKGILRDLSLTKKYYNQNMLQKGYQLFDLYGFALLYESYHDMDVFSDRRFRKAITYGVTYKNIKALIEPKINRYAFPYNSPAFEYKYVSETFFGKSDNAVNSFLEENMLNTFYDKRTNAFSNNTEDGETLTARVYELLRTI